MKRYFRALTCTVALVAAVSPARAGSYRIDINDANNAVTHSGWSGLNAAYTGNGGSVTVGGINFYCSSCDGARLRGTVGSPSPDALLGDFVFDDGSGQAAICHFGGAGDLPAGEWEVSMYIWDATLGAGMGNSIVAYRRNASATTYVNNFVPPSATGPAITFRFTSDGTSSYDVFVRENNGGNQSRLNAVELRPVTTQSSTPYSTSVMAQNPLELYRLESVFGENGDPAYASGVALDQSAATSASLTSTGTPAFVGHGSANTWATFSGADVALSDLASGMSSDEGSVSFWVRLNTGAGDTTKCLFMGIATGGQGTFGGAMTDTLGVFTRNNGSVGCNIASGGLDESSSGLLVPNRWHHYAATWKRNTGSLDGVIRVYVDGVEQAGRTDRSWSSFDFDEVQFGNEINGDDRTFAGDMDELALWGRELTQQEIVEQYWHGIRQYAQVVLTEGFHGMPADNSNPYTASLDGQNGWEATSPNVVIRNNLNSWGTHLGGEGAYTGSSSSSQARKDITPFAGSAGTVTIEFSGRASGQKSLLGIGHDDGSSYAPLLWFGPDPGPVLRLSTHDQNGTHQLLTQSFSPPQPQLMRVRCVIDIEASTGSVSYYDGATWQFPASFQNQEMYIGSGRDEHTPEKWNKIAFTGNTTSGSLWDNIVVVYEPPRGTLFTLR